MQLKDFQLNTLYFMVYDDCAMWFINEFYSKHEKTYINGKCVKCSVPEAADIDTILTISDLRKVIICIKIPDLNTFFETHPHLFI